MRLLVRTGVRQRPGNVWNFKVIRRYLLPYDATICPKDTNRNGVAGNAFFRGQLNKQPLSSEGKTVHLANGPKMQFLSPETKFTDVQQVLKLLPV